MRHEPRREPSWPAFILGLVLIVLGIALSCAVGCGGGATYGENCGNPFNSCPAPADTAEVAQ